MKLFLLLCTLASVASSSAFAAGYCDLIGTEIYAQDKAGTFLGLVSDNPYLTESITNKYGNFGSKYGTTSILNEYGTFGGKYSTYSPYNPYTTSPPVLLSYDTFTKKYSPVAYLTKNKYIGGAYVDPDLLFGTLLSGSCIGGYIPPVVTKADLIVDSLMAYFSDGKDSIYISYILVNVGTAPSVAFQVGTVVRNSRTDTIAFPALNPNKYFSDYRGFKITEDTTRVGIWVDFFNSTPEFQEDNNLAIADFLTPMRVSARLPYIPKPNANPRGSFDALGRPPFKSIRNTFIFRR